jgi:hypothetical protein
MFNLTVHTAKQLRSYSIKTELENTYYLILESAKIGLTVCEFNLSASKADAIISELYWLFPDTRITKLYTIHDMITYKSSWH